nr:hypothetical protein [Tanacetum cinerariifolium]
MIELRETFQTWLQQQVVNLDSYTFEPSQCQKIPIYYDDEDDEESFTPLRDINIFELPPYEFIKSSVENLVPNPSEYEGLSNIESDCNVPVGRSEGNLFEPFFDEEIISIKIDPLHFNAESDLIESLLNQDSSIISSPKIDSLLEEFSGELAHINLIPPGINEADFDPEEEIRLVEKLLYDNSSSRPQEKPNSKNSDAVIESFSLSHIPVEGSDSLIDEIDIFLALDDSMPPGIENDDYDS